jgi:hypothetical protein
VFKLCLIGMVFEKVLVVQFLGSEYDLAWLAEILRAFLNTLFSRRFSRLGVFLLAVAGKLCAKTEGLTSVLTWVEARFLMIFHVN